MLEKDKLELKKKDKIKDDNRRFTGKKSQQCNRFYHKFDWVLAGTQK